jgi:hypothetical protein
MNGSDWFYYVMGYGLLGLGVLFVLVIATAIPRRERLRESQQRVQELEIQIRRLSDVTEGSWTLGPKGLRDIEAALRSAELDAQHGVELLGQFLHAWRNMNQAERTELSRMLAKRQS